MRKRDGRWIGIVAAGVGLGAAELVAGVLGGRSPFGAVADATIAATPGPVVRLAIALLGTANRLVLLIVMAGIVIAAGAWAGMRATAPGASPGDSPGSGNGTPSDTEPTARRTGDPRALSSAVLAPVAVFGGFALLAAAAGLADPSIAPLPAILAPGAGALVGLMALWILVTTARATDPPATPVEARAVGSSSRRRLLTVGAGTAALAVAAAVGGRALTRAPVRLDPGTGLAAPSRPLPAPASDMSFDVDGLSPLVTQNDDFFRIDTAFSIPRVDAERHDVQVTGLVDRPFTLSYADLVSMADTEADITLACVSNEVGGDLVGTARWQGVPLARLLDDAGVQPGATQVVGRSVDGWTSGFPVEAALDGRPALVAVGMNGEPLPRKHGFPVRLVIAGLYGYVCNTKWLSEIELTTFEAHDAYWVPRGWAVHGPIKTQSRIDVPRSGATVPAGGATVAGVAWSNEYGITRVEVAVDDGEWREADLAEPLATTTWRQWQIDWDAEPGDHQLRVRAFDAEGEPQTDTRQGPAPDGATGHHTIRVNVT